MAWGIIDRKEAKREARAILRGAQVSPMGILLLYMGIVWGLHRLRGLSGVTEAAHRFTGVLVTLLAMILSAGFTLYCMAIRRGERAEYAVLFKGFAFAGKLILLFTAELFFLLAWGSLLIVPGIIAAYRYSFAVYNLCENPDIGIMEAIEMSKRQTMGYKSQLFTLDLSYLGWRSLASIWIPIRIWITVRLLTQGSPYMYLLPFHRFEALAGPAWLWMILLDVWSLLVGLFYIPNMQCVRLAYFETAKRTSGIGEGAGEAPTPRLEDREDGTAAPLT